MLTYKKFCASAYQRYVDSLDIPIDLRTGLKTSERVPMFINNLSLELDKIQADRIRTGKPIFSDHAIEAVIKDMTEVFISGIKIKAQQMYESDIAKSIREAKADEQKAMEQTSEGVISGDYKEFITTESELNGQT